MIIGSEFTKFMSAYWNEMAADVFGDLQGSVSAFVEMEGHEAAKELLQNFEHLIEEGAFFDRVEFEREPLRSMNFHRVLVNAQSRAIVLQLKGLIK